MSTEYLAEARLDDRPSGLMQQSIPDLFVRQVARSPDAPALRDANTVLTYAQLDRLACRLAGQLDTMGIEPGNRIGICAVRSIESVVAMIAILKHGSSYVPLDPAYPVERLQWAISDAAVPLVIVAGEQEAIFSGLGVRSFVLDLQAMPEPLGKRSVLAASPCAPEAYLLYTSGSTGLPKGVLVAQQSIVNLVCDTDYVDLSYRDVVAHASNISFDAATFEVWGALLNGASLSIIRTDELLDAARLSSCIAQQGVTTLFVPTAVLNRHAQNKPDCFAGLRQLLFGGEQARPELVSRIRQACPSLRLVHVYGPTETTTFASWYEVPATIDASAELPIGQAIRGVELVLRDDSLAPVAAGESGEICISGAGVALGYLNRDEISRERFVARPGEPRFYRTGDLACWSPQGGLVFQGRIDHQVKIRGYRVEPGEIEAQLGADEQLRDAVVLAEETADGDRRLCAYIVARAPGQPPDIAALRERLARRIPEYMMPTRWQLLDELPLNANGKLDRQALMASELAPQAGSESVLAPPQAPLTGTAGTLSRIWCEVLERDGIGKDDDFFDLGGHSLLAVSLLARIEESFGQALRLATFFEAPTIRSQAALLETVDQQAIESQTGSVVAVQPLGEATPLFFVSGFGGAILPFHELGRRLGENQPLHVLDLAAFGPDEQGTAPSVVVVAARMIEDIRRLQPSGPYQLAGYSLGGKFVWEMAQQLRQAGEQVRLLALLDCQAPGYPASNPFLIQVYLHLHHAWSLPWPEMSAYLLEKTRELPQHFRRVRKSVFADAPQADSVVHQTIERSALALLASWEAYEPTRYGGRLTLIRAGVRRFKPGQTDQDPCQGWWPLVAGGIDVRPLQCRHNDMLDAQHAPALAEILRDCMAET